MSMTISEFFSKYANTRLNDRFQIITHESGMTLADVYKEMQAIEDKIRPDVIREQELCRLAEIFFRAK